MVQYLKEKHSSEALLSVQEINDNFKNTFWIYQLKGHFLQWKHVGDLCHFMWKQCCIKSDPTVFYNALQVSSVDQILDIWSRQSLSLVFKRSRSARWHDGRPQIKLSTALSMGNIHPSTCAALFWPTAREQDHETNSIYCEKWHPSPCLGQAGESSQAESKGKKKIWDKFGGIKGNPLLGMLACSCQKGWRRIWSICDLY